MAWSVILSVVGFFSITVSIWDEAVVNEVVIGFIVPFRAAPAVSSCRVLFGVFRWDSVDVVFTLNDVPFHAALPLMVAVV